MPGKRGSTLTEVVVVMAIVEIMTVMVVSFSLIVNSWVSLGASRYHNVQNSDLVSQAFHEFVTAYDSSSFIYEVTGEDPGSLCIYSLDGNDEKVLAHSMSFDPEEKTLSYDLGGDRSLKLEGIDDVDFGVVVEGGKVVMLTARISYTYVTPGKTVSEQQREYYVVASLRSAPEVTPAPVPEP